MIHISDKPHRLQAAEIEPEGRRGREVAEAPLADGEPGGDEADDEQDLQAGQGVLDPGAGLEAAGVEEGEGGDDQDGVELLHDRRLGGAADDARMEEAGEGPGQVLREADGRRGDGRGEADEERDPAGEEAEDGMVEPREEGVFPAGLGKAAPSSP